MTLTIKQQEKKWRSQANSCWSMQIVLFKIIKKLIGSHIYTTLNLIN